MIAKGEAVCETGRQRIRDAAPADSIYSERADMAKLLSDHITAADLGDFISRKSDFAFELAVLEILNAANLVCRHGGTYKDSITGKSRQYDIRAELLIGPSYHLSFAVECKNLQPHFPLLVHAIPRRNEESFHSILATWPPNPAFGASECQLHGDVIKCANLYLAGDPVVKHVDQVGRTRQGIDGLTSEDRECYDKWTQAIASCRALVNTCYLLGRAVNAPDLSLSCILPILVVPDGMLWQVDYDATGRITKPPHLVSHCSMYVDEKEVIGGQAAKLRQYRISHLEIVTCGALLSAIQCLAAQHQKFFTVFPGNLIQAQIGRNVPAPIP